MITVARSLLVFALSGAVASITFEPYQSAGSYKCGQYKRGRVEDRALGQFYSGIRQVIGWLNQPFPHQDLLNDRALLGDQQELQASFENKYPQWLQFEEGNLAVLAGILSISIAFPIVYILIRCISACCRAVSKEKQGLNAVEERWDGCKRHLLNTFLIIFVLIDVFAAAALLVTGQYAEYGLEQLPGRLNQCIDDLNLYKRDTDGQIRKLLIDDWRVLNSSLIAQMDGTGSMIVERVKKVTGAHGLDVFMTVSQEAREVQTVLRSAKDLLMNAKEDATVFANEFNKLRKHATEQLNGCLNNREFDEHVKSVCSKASQFVDGLNKMDVNIDTSFMEEFDQESVDRFLLTDVTSMLEESNEIFRTLGDQIQSEIDGRTGSAKNVLKKIGDDLFLMAEQASGKIRQINFDPLYTAVAAYTDNKEINIVQYVKYSWYASLLITGIFVLLSLAFLFGLFYGLCGRGNSYYNDDCCTRSTGSRFYSCGIWLSLLFFTVLSLAASILFFVFSNTTHLLCDPLERPLERPDMMTLADRYTSLFTHNESEMERMMKERNVAEVMRGCGRNETFYSIFDLDSLFQINQLETKEKDALDKLDSTLTMMIDQVNIRERMDNFLPPDLFNQLQKLRDVNVTKLSEHALKKIEDGIAQLDLEDKVKEFQENIAMDEKPLAVALVLLQVESTARDLAAPLRQKLRVLHSNLTQLDVKLSDLHIPVDSLLSKLQHAQVLLSDDVRSHVIAAAREVIEQLKGNCNDYIRHVKREVQQEMSSCTPVTQTIIDARDAVCEYTIDPINGSWMSMLICLAVTIPIIILCTTLISLYNKIMTYPKYAHEPLHDHFVSSFITDTYETRRKPMHGIAAGPNYSNYSYAGEYHTPYLR